MENIFALVMGGTIDLLEIYIIFRYMMIFFENEYINAKLTYIAYAVRFFISLSLRIVSVTPLLSAGISYGSIFLISLCYMTILSKKLIISVFIYMCSFISEIVVAMIVGIGGFDILGHTEQISLFWNLIIELIFWIISLIVRRFKNTKGELPAPKPFIASIIVIPISLICLECVVFSQEKPDSLLVGISLLCLVTSIFILMYLYDSLAGIIKERTASAIAIKEKEYYHQQAELLADKYTELNKYRHDMKNRMITIQQMIDKKKYNSISKYIGNLAEKIEHTSTYCNTGNIALDSIVNYKLTKMTEMGIFIKSDLIIPRNLPIDEDDLIVIVGNLLDNAMEGTECLKKDIDKSIQINFSYEIGSIWICVKNTYNGCLQHNGENFLTSKEDKTIHGLGLQNVKAVVEKYNGLLEFSTDDIFFEADVLLYL